MVAMTATSLYGPPLQVQMQLNCLTTKMTKMPGAIEAAYVALLLVLSSQLAPAQTCSRHIARPAGKVFLPPAA